MFTQRARIESVMVDEAEHLHAAWNISRGELPYRDFFEHHPPLLWYLAVPIVKGRTSTGAHFIRTLRLIALCVTVVTAGSFYLWFRRSFGMSVSFCAVALLLTAFRYSFVEIRPDTPAMLFMFAGLWQIGLRRSDPHARLDIHVLITGLCFGIAACFTQKAMICFFAITVWFIPTILLAEKRVITESRG